MVIDCDGPPERRAGVEPRLSLPDVVANVGPEVTRMLTAALLVTISSTAVTGRGHCATRLTNDSPQPPESRRQAASSNAVGPVLLADDEESIRIATRACLEALGFDDIRVAANGDECVRMLTDRPVSVLLIDLLMPGTGGRGVLKAVKDLPADQRPGRIVVMSGIDDTDVAADLVSMGADVVLPKPFLLDELRAALFGGGA